MDFEVTSTLDVLNNDTEADRLVTLRSRKSKTLLTSHSDQSGRTVSKLIEQSAAWLRLTSYDKIEDIDRLWLHGIYEQGFEMIFGSWMGKYSNPFV